MVDLLFVQFNKNITSADLPEKKIRCIADLFQTLEWLHPFRDGQTRTDLVLLSKLLCEQGFNPAFLEEPSASSFCFLDEWVSYLKNGMAQWREEFNALNPIC